MTTIRIWDNTGNLAQERRFEVKAEALAWAHRYMEMAPSNYSFSSYTE